MSHGNAMPALPGGGRENRRFRAVLNAMVPEAETMSDREWQEAQVIIWRAVTSRTAATRRQIALFLRLLDLTSLARHGRPFPVLNTNEATHLLEKLSKSRLLLLRRGVWGVRTLAFMGYYARPEAARTIGYRADANGWSARREASATRD